MANKLQKTKDISCCYIEDTKTVRKNYKLLEKYDPSDPELKSFYSKQNKLYEVDGLGSINDIRDKINTVIDNL